MGIWRKTVNRFEQPFQLVICVYIGIRFYNDYRQLRVSLGYAQHPHYPVREFIGYLLEKYPESDIITKEMFDSS